MPSQTGEHSVDDLERRFNRQGPGLAMALLLLMAGAGAALALSKAVRGLYATGRQRAYQYAVLLAIGAREGAERGALMVEQAVILAIGVLGGAAAGALSAVVSLRRIPFFTVEPTTSPLDYALDLWVLAAMFVSSVAVIAVAVTLVTGAIQRPAGVEALREATP